MSYYSIADGNWNTAGTWSVLSFGGVPTTTTPIAGDSIFIKGYSVTIQTAHAACSRLSIYGSGNANGLLEVKAGYDLLVTGDVGISADNGSHKAQLYIRNWSKVDVNGNLRVLKNGGTNKLEIRLYDDSELELRGNLLTEVADGSMDLYVSCYNAARITVRGNIIMTHRSGVNNIFFNLFNTNLISIGGNLYFNYIAGTGRIEFDIWKNSILDVEGDIDFVANKTGKDILAAFDGTLIYIGGSFTKNAVPNNYGILRMLNNSTLIYDGTSPQSVAGESGAGTDGFTFQNILFLNTAPKTPQMVLGSDMSVTDLYLLGGVLELGEFDLIIKADGNIYNASSTAYIDVSAINSGVITKLFKGPEIVTFPIGIGTEYTPFTFTLNTASFVGTPSVSIQIVDSSHPFMLTGGDHIERYWILDSDSFTAMHYDVNFSYVDADINGDENNIISTFHDGTTYNHMSLVNAPMNALKGEGITAIPDFFAFTGGSQGAIPVMLILFDAYPSGDIVKVEWITASEVDNDNFRVERSNDGRSWASLGREKAAGNSNTTVAYEFKDKAPLEGVSYYRLIQTDFDGATVTFGPVTVIRPKGYKWEAKAWPNPLVRGNKLQIQMSLATPDEDVLVIMIDVMGSEVYSKVLISNGEGIINCGELEERLGSGVYFITASSQRESFQQKLIITTK